MAATVERGSDSEPSLRLVGAQRVSAVSEPELSPGYPGRRVVHRALLRSHTTPSTQLPHTTAAGTSHREVLGRASDRRSTPTTSATPADRGNGTSMRSPARRQCHPRTAVSRSPRESAAHTPVAFRGRRHPHSPRRAPPPQRSRRLTSQRAGLPHRSALLYLVSATRERRSAEAPRDSATCTRQGHPQTQRAPLSQTRPSRRAIAPSEATASRTPPSMRTSPRRKRTGERPPTHAAGTGPIHTAHPIPDTARRTPVEPPSAHRPRHNDAFSTVRSRTRFGVPVTEPQRRRSAVSSHWMTSRSPSPCATAAAYCSTTSWSAGSRSANASGRPQIPDG